MIVELAIAAYTSSPSIRSYSPPVRSYSTPRTYTPPPSRSSSSPKSWSSSAKYGSGKSSKVGTSKLKSSTKPPKAHRFGGRTYNSSAAQYTNTHGVWVWYWLMVATATNNDGDKKELQCFDKNHKRTTCNRDKKSYQRSW